MKLLLDTHVLLWLVSDDARLHAKARRHIESAEQLIYSVASIWEIAIKQSLGRPDFRLAEGWEEELLEEFRINGIRRLDIDVKHCLSVAQLPWEHRDPFDRLLIAQAACEKFTILSCDIHFKKYAIDVVW